MIKIGKTNTLKVLRSSELGSYLDAEHLDDVFLADGIFRKEGDLVDVFIYKDADSKIAATTDKAIVELDQCAYLEVVAHNSSGAFLNWGIPKDLFVPLNQQEEPMKVLKACSFLMSELSVDAHDNIYAYEGMGIIADLLTDAVSRVDAQMQEERSK